MSEDKCGDCGGRGWLHMGEPFEIQACGECQAVDGCVNDAAARAKHKQDHPNCQWPDLDIHDSFLRQISYVLDEKIPDEILVKVQAVYEQARSRLGFPASWSTLLYKLGEIIDRMEQLSATQMAWRHLEHAIAYVVQAQWRMKNGKWTLAHALTPDDGFVFDGDQWKVSPLEKDKQR